MSTFTTHPVATISSPTSRAADTVVDVVSNELLLLGKIEATIEPAPLLSRPSSTNEDESDSHLSLGKSDAAYQGALVLSDLGAGTRAVRAGVGPPKLLGSIRTILKRRALQSWRKENSFRRMSAGLAAHRRSFRSCAL